MSGFFLFVSQTTQAKAEAKAAKNSASTARLPIVILSSIFMAVSFRELMPLLALWTLAASGSVKNCDAAPIKNTPFSERRLLSLATEAF
ncbi:hypothetical protein [Shewanella sedimentimangrovi]|uniref:Uncharacterized protein n=1 Tax=Shewanella sedimentimangrovi TaxID=2814293 RepID=A0ABX7R4S5_9GAMM|nr:hypothetical protein [Shewanella sedimentimangrovi]QSX38847.1 hypothetical protein JYB85_08615 [Shewanella sedimentimangrovi]